MNIKRILFATDFSANSQSAFCYATALARDTGATLFILHVQEPPSLFVPGERYLALVDITPELKKMLYAVVPPDKNVPCEHRLRNGKPADEIIALAKAEHVDVIVLGTHGRTGLSRLLMGSVAEAVMRRAPCPVLTLKPTCLMFAAPTET